MGDKAGISSSLSNLGLVALSQNDYPMARTLIEESLALSRETGDKWGIAISLSNLEAVALLQGDYATARAMGEECRALCQEMDDQSTLAYALFGLGMVELVEDHSAAQELLLHSLRLRQEIGEQREQTSCLIGLAALALRGGNPRRAAQLLGAVEAALHTLQAVMDAVDQHFYASTLTTTRAQLGEATFQATWAEGEKMTLEEVVQLALQETS